MEDLVLYLTSVFDSQYFVDIPSEIKQICYAIIITTVSLVLFISCVILMMVAVLSIFNFIKRR